jgi:hypothetical protein
MPQQIVTNLNNRGDLSEDDAEHFVANPQQLPEHVADALDRISSRLSDSFSHDAVGRDA